MLPALLSPIRTVGPSPPYDPIGGSHPPTGLPAALDQAALDGPVTHSTALHFTVQHFITLYSTALQCTLNIILNVYN